MNTTETLIQISSTELLRLQAIAAKLETKKPKNLKSEANKEISELWKAEKSVSGIQKFLKQHQNTTGVKFYLSQLPGHKANLSNKAFAEFLSFDTIIEALKLSGSYYKVKLVRDENGKIADRIVTDEAKHVYTPLQVLRGLEKLANK